MDGLLIKDTGNPTFLEKLRHAQPRPDFSRSEGLLAPQRGIGGGTATVRGVPQSQPPAGEVAGSTGSNGGDVTIGDGVDYGNTGNGLDVGNTNPASTENILSGMNDADSTDYSSGVTVGVNASDFDGATVSTPMMDGLTLGETFDREFGEFNSGITVKDGDGAGVVLGEDVSKAFYQTTGNVDIALDMESAIREGRLSEVIPLKDGVDPNKMNLTLADYDIEGYMADLASGQAMIKATKSVGVNMLLGLLVAGATGGISAVTGALTNPLSYISAGLNWAASYFSNNKVDPANTLAVSQALETELTTGQLASAASSAANEASLPVNNLAVDTVLQDTYDDFADSMDINGVSTPIPNWQSDKNEALVGAPSGIANDTAIEAAEKEAVPGQTVVIPIPVPGVGIMHSTYKVDHDGTLQPTNEVTWTSLDGKAMDGSRAAVSTDATSALAEPFTDPIPKIDSSLEAIASDFSKQASTDDVGWVIVEGNDITPAPTGTFTDSIPKVDNSLEAIASDFSSQTIIGDDYDPMSSNGEVMSIAQEINTTLAEIATLETQLSRSSELWRSAEISWQIKKLREKLESYEIDQQIATALASINPAVNIDLGSAGSGATVSGNGITGLTSSQVGGASGINFSGGSYTPNISGGYRTSGGRYGVTI